MHSSVFNIGGCAREKAGIFKTGVPAIVNCLTDLEPVFTKRAEEVGAPLCFVRNAQINLLKNEYWEPAFAGAHQMKKFAHGTGNITSTSRSNSRRDCSKAIQDAPYLTGLRGRLDEIEWPGASSTSEIFLDVGHNPEALLAVREFFEAMNVRPTVIFGIMQDKEIDTVLKIIKVLLQILLPLLPIPASASQHRACFPSGVYRLTSN